MNGETAIRLRGLLNRATVALILPALALATAGLIAAYIVATSGEPARASHAGGMDTMSLDMDPTGNTATSLGTREVCARINENGIQDADEDSVDTVTLDATATNIPAGTAMIGFTHSISYNESELTIQSQNINFLLGVNAGSSVVDVGDLAPDVNNDNVFLTAAGDVGPIPASAETGSGVLNRLTIETDPGASTGWHQLIMYGAQHIETDSTPHAADAIHSGTIAVDLPCPAANPIVDTTSDSPSLTACTVAAGDCSLRGAIGNLNASPDSGIITFDSSQFPTLTPATISLGSPLPAMSPAAGSDVISGGGAGVIIDGVTDSFVCFTLNGADFIFGIEVVKNCSTAFLLTAAGQQIGAANLPEAGGDCADTLDQDDDSFVNDGCVQAGPNAESGADCSNSSDDDTADVDGLTNDGCPPRGEGMVIQDNLDYGIRITGEAADSAFILGNYIGTSKDGTGAVPNGTGIGVDGGADNAGIGGGLAGFRNLISGNTSAGVSISGSGTTSNILQGNYIGTNADGTAVIANGEGVAIVNDASGNSVGGSIAAARNVISGNTGHGIKIGESSGAATNSVLGNYIGLAADGVSDLGNGGVGVLINAPSSANNTIGGTNAAESVCIGVADEDADGYANDGCPQVLSTAESGANCANSTDDDLVDSDGSVNDGCPARGSGNVISGNTSYGVRMNVSGTGNVVKGNYIGTDAIGAAGVPNSGDGVRIEGGAAGNTIGGSTSGDRNVISGNTGHGVKVTGSGSTGNTISGNYVGLTAAGDTALGNVNGIVIEAGGLSNTVGGSTAGHRNLISGNTTYGVVITGLPATGNVVKGNYIGTDVTGTLDRGNGQDGVRISADAASNTIGGSTAADRNVIAGNNDDGVEINLANSNTVSGNYIGLKADGTDDLANSGEGVAIAFGATGNTIGGSTSGHRNIISGNTGSGIKIQDESSDGNIVKSNYIGTTAAGTGVLGNGFVGVEITGGADGTVVGGSAGTTPGGSCTGECNLVSGNGGGILMTGAATTGAVIKGNYVGTNASGTGAIPNTSNSGIYFSFSSNNTVGGSTPGERNLISGNQFDGVLIAAASGNVVKGNFIGTNSAGTAGLANQIGVRVDSSSSNTIGGIAAGEGNTIAHNTEDGVCVTQSGTSNSVRGNSIYANGFLGIDLDPTAPCPTGAVTDNDLLPTVDADTGPNGLMNFPVITAVSYNNGTRTFTVAGTLANPSASTATVDVYATDVVDGSGNGEGRRYLGSATPINSNPPDPGNWTFTMTGAPAFGFISATATDSSNNTSEFSATYAADVDGDSFPSSTDNCDVVHNPLQLDHDADGVGDACDAVVRNRATVSESSFVTEFSVPEGESLGSASYASLQWDFQPGNSIDVGAILGSLDFAARLRSATGICDMGYSALGVTLYNASLDNSAGNLVSAAGMLLDANGNNIKDGAEKYPGFLNTLLDPQRRTGIDEDADGFIDEDPADGADNDVPPDGKVDEDGAGTPAVPHARYFGSYTIFGIINQPYQLLVFEEVPNIRYRAHGVFGDPTGVPGAGTLPVCAAFEARTTVLSTSNPNGSAIPPVPGGVAVLNTPPPGTHVTKAGAVDFPDTDGDGKDNVDDNCRLVTNATQTDSDLDAIGDACELSPEAGAQCANAIDDQGNGKVNDGCPLAGVLVESGVQCDNAVNDDPGDDVFVNDGCPAGPCTATAALDCDGDGQLNVQDNCPFIANVNQAQGEVRTPRDIGIGLANDKIGDLCDANPTLVDDAAEVGVQTFSDPICVTGTNVTDADGDGWCTYGNNATIATGTQPDTAAVNHNTNRVYVTNTVSDTLSVIDGLTDTEIAEFAVGNGPGGVGVNTFTNRIYVANGFDNNVKLIDGTDNSIDATISVGTTPTSLAVNEAVNRIYVLNTGSNSVSVIDGYTNTEITGIPLASSPSEIAVNPHTGRVYVTRGTASLVDVIDGETNAVIATISAGGGPTGLAVHPTLNRVFVANTGDVSVIDGYTNTEIDTDGNSGNGMTRISTGGNPLGVAVAPGTDRVYVTNVGQDNVSVVDGSTLLEVDSDGNGLITRVPVGDGPNTIGVNAVTGRLYVVNSSSGNVSVIALGSDLNDASAANTPERAGAYGSCTNGVDDDGTGGTDSADVHCADADGDTVPDAADVCPQAADPLQLDDDGDGRGDACEDRTIASLSLGATTNAANSELRNRLVEVAPDKLHRTDGIINFIDPDFTVAGSGVADGAIRAALSSMVTVAIDPNPGTPSTTTKVCNNVLPYNFTLLDASTDTSMTISPGTNFSALLADVVLVNGLADGVDRYPLFLKSLPGASARTNNDADFGTDEDPLDGVDNDQDGFVDEDPYDHVTPHARLFGRLTFQGAAHVLNVLVYSPGALPQHPASKGYVVMFIYNDPTALPSNGNITAWCSHQDHRLFQYGVALDNPATAGPNEGGAALITNDSAPGTESFFTQMTSLADVDGDGIENALDVCTFAADNDHDGTSDATDATPWNPRLVAPPGDPDADGLPTGCDRAEGLAPAVGECGADAVDSDFDVKVNDGCPAVGPAESGANCDNAVDNDGDSAVNDGCPARGDPNVASPPGSGPDEDGDHIENLLDNCPYVSNEDQTDSDADGIGNVCDPAPAQHSAGAQQTVSGTPVCTGATDADGDGYCAGTIGENDTPGFGSTIVPEVSAYEPEVCTDAVDNDVDTFTDLADSGCGDLDIDGVLNELDNCPGIPPATPGVNYNPSQENSDAASETVSLGQQPYARSSEGTPTGDPSTVVGEPYARSDNFGGDACDPDDDNDYLPDGNGAETGACRTDSDCDNDFLGDWPEYLRACLNMTVPNTSGMWAAGGNGDGDALFTYGEALIGTDPCTTTTGADFNTDEENPLPGTLGDGYLSGMERYVGTNRLDRCGVGVETGPSLAWPSDFASGGVPGNSSTDRITLTDVLSFVAPVRRLDTTPASPNFSRRWDLVPGPGVVPSWINISDLLALVAEGPTGKPPMFGGVRAFLGPTCTAGP